MDHVEHVATTRVGPHYSKERQIIAIGCNIVADYNAFKEVDTRTLVQKLLVVNQE